MVRLNEVLNNIYDTMFCYNFWYRRRRMDEFTRDPVITVVFHGRRVDQYRKCHCFPPPYYGNTREGTQPVGPCENDSEDIGPLCIFVYRTRWMWTEKKTRGVQTSS